MHRMKWIEISYTFEDSFFRSVSLNKLEQWKLDVGPFPIVATPTVEDGNLKMRVAFSQNDTSFVSHAVKERYHGYLYAYNTKEEFVNANKSEMALEISNCVDQDFCVLSYSDLKANKIFYWICWPAKVISFQNDGVQVVDDLFEFEIVTLNAPLTEALTDSLISRTLFVTNDTCNKCWWPGRSWLVKEGERHGPGRYLVNVYDLSKNELVQAIVIIKESEFKGSNNYSQIAIGWELNDKKLPGPKIKKLEDNNSSLSRSTESISSNSVNLNLSLMKWRMFPSLDLEKLRNFKVLLLGAGTLGCHIARDLLAWGVINITFVDSGRVSYSNPVRQPLFTIQDASGDGLYKADAAASALKSIHPDANGTGIVMNIPLPDRPLGNIDSPGMSSALQKARKLQQLIKSHDLSFVVTDTRESRWLPTILAKEANKPVISVGLGFDSYLVMRHGLLGSDLGCYFCTDVVSGPGNSEKNRAMDQQCTVTRPGVAPIASALAVELMVALVHAESGFTTDNEINATTPNSLGILPHQIRGFLSNFSSILGHVPNSEYCPACSPRVIDAMRTDFETFLFHSINEGTSYLEKITQLSERLDKLRDVSCEWEDS
jgi:E1-like protein-activating enzyme Gsa7p/Apg7p